MAVVLSGLVVAAAAAAAGDRARVFVASLSGDSEVPPVTTAGSGFSGFTLNEAETELAYELIVRNVQDVVAAHIHCAAVGANGPVGVTLFSGGPVAPDGTLASGTITALDAANVCGWADMAAVAAALRSGDTYVNVHTSPANPGGEVRGQIAPRVAVNFGAPLSGDQQVPTPVVTDGTGFAAISVNTAETELDFLLLAYDLEDVVAAHIHCAAVGANGPVGVTLFSGGPVAPDGTLASATITAPDAANACGWADMAAVAAALQSGDTYVNVHTFPANPGGEIRGQNSALDPTATEGGRFGDDDGTTHEGNIEVIAAASISLGCNPPLNTSFCPGDSLTRGQMAAFLFRTLNLKPVAMDFFTDDDGTLFETEINAIAAQGITKGCNPPLNTSFCPDDSVTRGQLASFFVRALGLTAGAGDNLFTDDDASVHETDIDRLGTAGITRGCNPPANDRYCPDDSVNRDQVASFIARAMGWTEMAP